MLDEFEEIDEAIQDWLILNSPDLYDLFYNQSDTD